MYFNFTTRFMCNDIQRFHKLKTVSVKIFELSFRQDQKTWKHKLVPLGVNENESDRVIDLLFYKN